MDKGKKKGRGRPRLGLSDSAKKERKKDQDRKRWKKTKKLTMEEDVHTRWLALASQRGVSPRQLARLLVDAVEEGRLRLTTE